MNPNGFEKHFPFFLQNFRQRRNYTEKILKKLDNLLLKLKIPEAKLFFVFSFKSV